MGRQGTPRPPASDTVILPSTSFCRTLSSTSSLRASSVKSDQGTLPPRCATDRPARTCCWSAPDAPACVALRRRLPSGHRLWRAATGCAPESSGRAPAIATGWRRESALFPAAADSRRVRHAGRVRAWSRRRHSRSPRSGRPHRPAPTLLRPVVPRSKAALVRRQVGGEQTRRGEQRVAPPREAAR